MKTLNLTALKLNMDLKTLHHELRTPLTGILGLAELLKHESLSAEQLSDVEAISACGERLLRFYEVLFSSLQVLEPIDK